MMRSVNLALMEAVNHRRRLEAQSSASAAFLHVEAPADGRAAPRLAPQRDADDCFVISMNGDDA